MITPENIVMHELIGLGTEIVKSNNEQIVGLRGRVIDETKWMLVISTQKGIKKIPKENTQWKFYFDNKETLVYGNMLAKRPQERLGAKT